MIRAQTVYGNQENGFPRSHLRSPPRGSGARTELPFRHWNSHRGLHRLKPPLIHQVVQILVVNIQEIWVLRFQCAKELIEQAERRAAKILDGRVEVNRMHRNDSGKASSKTILGCVQARVYGKFLRGGG